MKQLISISMVAIGMTACSTDGGGTGVTGAVAEKTTTRNEETSDIGVGPVEAHFRFVQNGCDTGYHVLQSEDAQSTRQKFCDALQDDTLNRSCAESLRRDAFQKICEPATWTATKTPTETTTPQRQEPRTFTLRNAERAKEERVRTALTTVFADNVTVSTSLKGSEKKFATQLAEDLKGCGLSFVGPKCKGVYTSSLDAGLTQLDGKNIFYSDVGLVGGSGSSSVIFVFSIDELDPTVKVSKLRVLKAARQSHTLFNADFLKLPSNFTELLALDLASDAQTAALARIDNPQDVRELYHAADFLLTTDRSSAFEMTSRVSRAFERNSGVLTEIKASTYQLDAVGMMFDRLKLSPVELVKISDSLLKSENRDVRERVAVEMLLLNTANSKLKPLVLSALKNEDWQIRQKAVRALGRADHRTKDEERQILRRVADDVDSVQKSAVEAGERFDLDESHLGVLEALAKHDDWTVRDSAVVLIGKVAGARATDLLIARLGDDIGYVRTHAVEQLEKRSLGQGEVVALEKQLRSEDWQIRLAAVQQLSKVGGDAVSNILIAALADDITYVRAEVVRALSTRALTVRALPSFKKVLVNDDWQVRNDAVLLLAKIDGPDVTLALIGAMGDDIDMVRKSVSEKIEIRDLGPEMVASLAKNLKHEDWQVRQQAAKFLGRIRHPSAEAALRKQLQSENIDSTRHEIERAIVKLK